MEVTEEERIYRLENKLKNEYVEKLKNTFDKIRENSKVDYTPSKELTFLGEKYKK